MLVNTKMNTGQDPDDFFFVLDWCHGLLEEMVQTVHDERYGHMVLQALPEQYERVRNASYEKRDFRLVDIRHIVHTMFVDSISCPPHSKSVAGCGIFMQVAGHTNSDVRCEYCRGDGHLLPDCAILKAKEQRHEPER